MRRNSRAFDTAISRERDREALFLKQVVLKLFFIFFNSLLNHYHSFLHIYTHGAEKYIMDSSCSFVFPPLFGHFKKNNLFEPNLEDGS